MEIAAHLPVRIQSHFGVIVRVESFPELVLPQRSAKPRLIIAQDHLPHNEVCETHRGCSS